MVLLITFGAITGGLTLAWLSFKNGKLNYGCVGSWDAFWFSPLNDIGLFPIVKYINFDQIKTKKSNFI